MFINFSKKNKVISLFLLTILVISFSGNGYVRASEVIGEYSYEATVDITEDVDEEIISFLEDCNEIDDFEVSDDEVVLTSDGVDYVITEKIVDDNKVVTLSYDDTVISYVVDDNTISSVVYESSENFWGDEVLKEVDSYEADVTEYAKTTTNNEVNGQYSWNTRVDTAPFGGTTYYYRSGQSSYGNDYYQVGTYKNVSQKTNYNIPYYKLSSSEKKQVKTYKTNVQNSSYYYTLGSGACSTTTWGIIVAAVIVSGATIEIPIAAIITAVGIVVGGYGTAVSYCVKSYYAKLNAADEFASTKCLGSKASY